jgi:hypothetical protein
MSATPRDRLQSSIDADRAARRAERGREQVQPIEKVARESKGLRRGGLSKSKPKRSAIPSGTLHALEVRSQGRCEVCPVIVRFDRAWVACDGLADDPHHRRRQGPGSARGGGHMLDNLLAACRAGHLDWIHNPRHENTARRSGLLVLPGDPGFDELGAEA